MNADQQIALVSVASGGAVGLGGVLVAGLGGWRDRKHARLLADTARTQDRLASAYVDLLAMAAKVGHWAQAVRPMLDTDPPQPPPPLPELDGQMAVNAKVEAYGSTEVKEKLDLWRSAVLAIQKADRLIGLRQEAADKHTNHRPKEGENLDWMDWHAPWSELEETLRAAEVAARTELSKQVSSELA